MSARTYTRAARGFTLIEAIVVIVITGILSGIVALFIRVPIQNYADNAARAELTDIADLAMQRLRRDIRLALPNSIVLLNNGSSIQFLITKTGGRYLSADDGAVGNELDFTDATKLTFDVVGPMPDARQAILPGDFIVVYNLGTGMSPADAYAGGNVATVTGVAGNTITMNANPFAVVPPVPVMESPNHRFQVVTGTVTYICNGVAPGAGTLTRVYSNTISSANPPVGAPALLANKVTACQFDYQALPNTHSAMVGVSLTLERPVSEGAVQLVQQIHVDNTP
ncbi:MAG TPA: prepilin-type cleavage/methylation domain-containing protein [Janthinobacterium sp.]|nr:prepilin-type cleavage/methylation domain-containing protein [Janthinobacterium sp.]